MKNDFKGKKDFKVKKTPNTFTANYNSSSSDDLVNQLSQASQTFSWLGKINSYSKHNQQG